MGSFPIVDFGLFSTFLRISRGLFTLEFNLKQIVVLVKAFFKKITVGPFVAAPIFSLYFSDF